MREKIELKIRKKIAINPLGWMLLKSKLIFKISNTLVTTPTRLWLSLIIKKLTKSNNTTILIISKKLDEIINNNTKEKAIFCFLFKILIRI